MRGEQWKKREGEWKKGMFILKFPSVLITIAFLINQNHMVRFDSLFMPSLKESEECHLFLLPATKRQAFHSPLPVFRSSWSPKAKSSSSFLNLFAVSQRHIIHKWPRSPLKISSTVLWCFLFCVFTNTLTQKHAVLL